MHPRFVLSLANFFGAAHFSLLVYIITPYLVRFMSEAQTGLVIAGGALVTLILFPLMPRLVVRFGNRKLAIVLASIQALATFGLALSPSPFFAILGIAVACALAPLIAYQLDLFLEAASHHSEQATGRIRTLFLTAANIACIGCPLLIGVLLDGTEEYANIFIAAALSLTPFIALLMVERLPEGSLPKTSKLSDTCKCIWIDPDLRAAAFANSVLQFFYHLAPFYIPLYLHTALGFEWSELGLVFTIMLLPFVFIEYPAGYIADRWLGEKELLVVGFVIMGLSFTAVGFITATTPLLLIAFILFMTRVGAALVEAMVEGHFFRRVSEHDAGTITVFRMMRPLGALIAPLFASLLLFTGNYLALFMISGGLIIAFGIFTTHGLRDMH